MSVVTVTNDNFEKEVVNSSVPVLIDFWASWCGPCRMLSPVIEEIASEVKDKKICKVNVDEQPELARKFGVMSIPTLVVMNNGELVKKGLSILMISSELPELLGMCDRIYVMSQGKIVGEMDAKSATQERIMSSILSVNKGA